MFVEEIGGQVRVIARIIILGFEESGTERSFDSSEWHDRLGLSSQSEIKRYRKASKFGGFKIITVKFIVPHPTYYQQEFWQSVETIASAMHPSSRPRASRRESPPRPALDQSW